MALEEKTKINQSSEADTQYVTIPAKIVQDHLYPFEGGEEVKIKVKPGKDKIVIEK